LVEVSLALCAAGEHDRFGGVLVLILDAHNGVTVIGHRDFYVRWAAKNGDLSPDRLRTGGVVTERRGRACIFF